MNCSRESAIRVNQHWSKRLASKGPIIMNENLRKLLAERYPDLFAPSAEVRSSISEDATSATTADGVNASDGIDYSKYEEAMRRKQR